ncbi:MAG: hypothetical protein HGB03_01450 [Candidatus Yonathbacteria bacterium]|nr:hypothetical protein [Candidatus Yonathbacteria bacterium]NTW47929.1 hypothetical protein [Candidatus Yonathbacteria bacterium]
MSVLPNDPSRFWPEDTSQKTDASGAHTSNESLADTFRTQSDTHATPTHTITHTPVPTSPKKSAHRFIPHLKKRTIDAVIPPVKTHTSHEPNTQSKEKDDWNIGAMIDRLDETFKEDMRKDAEGFPILPPLTKRVDTARSEGYRPEDEDEYGVIHTGARGPKQTPTGTIVFIAFVVLFITCLILFLTAFMMNVLN